ncbi:DNA repair and recombination protein RadB [Candidatus Woesearchaeota archaeon]|nr:DNA repair and recombination protein RadB [Candidatus Woesearchaeota archaeon]MBW3017195.1 DNA repair and recombination protein RadB [Candidatus Woesearchaeota archaeon]
MPGCEKISSGSAVVDELIGGYETDVITTFYGPSGSGKTNLCMISAIDVAGKKKVFYIDTEGGFSIERLKQITGDHENVLKNIYIFKPTSFDEQAKVINKLLNIKGNDVGLIIVDTISFLYRLELGDKDVHNTNRALGRQIAVLAEIARKKHIPVVITNQVYSDFDNRDKVKIVGGDLLKYGSKCLVELQKTPDSKRRAVVKKHRSLPEEKSIVFEIIDKGIKKTKEGKGFKIF